jgi:D-3-phosphoglycerate dehydrogenase
LEAEPSLRNLRRDARDQQDILERAFVQPSTAEHTRNSETRTLLLEGVHHSAVELLTDAGYTRIFGLQQALEGDALLERVRGTTILGVRSRTHLDAQTIEAADRLLAIGCFSVGTNQIDLEAARARGIPVFNAPFANTRSVAELVIGEIVMLLRQIFPRSAAAHLGEWRKSAAGSY